MVLGFGGWRDEVTAWHQPHLLNSLVSSTKLWCLWLFIKAGTVIGRDLTFTPHFIHFLPAKHNPGVWLAGILAFPPLIIPSSVKLQTHSLAPAPLLFPIQVSEYPVILSVENHCGIEQQRVMAQHLNHILGDKLLKNTLNGKAPVGLPSPEVNNATFFKKQSAI